MLKMTHRNPTTFAAAKLKGMRMAASKKPPTKTAQNNRPRILILARLR
ncbi:MAG: hypothetical protein H8K07_05255 [Nitrospira sp.]|nr:hypothetical protein [Nitrospira sp.]